MNISPWNVNGCLCLSHKYETHLHSQTNLFPQHVRCAFLCLLPRERKIKEDECALLLARVGLLKVLEPGRTDGLSASPLMLLRYACRPLKSTWWCCTRRYIQTERASAYIYPRALSARRRAAGFWWAAPLKSSWGRGARELTTHAESHSSMCVCVWSPDAPAEREKERRLMKVTARPEMSHTSPLIKSACAARTLFQWDDCNAGGYVFATKT